MRNGVIPALAECSPPLASFIDLTGEHGQKNPQNRQGLAIMERWAKKHAARGAEHVRRTQDTSNADRRVTLLGFKPPNIAKSLPSTFDIPCSTFCGSKRANVPIERRLTLLATYRPSTFDLPPSTFPPSTFDLPASHRLPQGTNSTLPSSIIRPHSPPSVPANAIRRPCDARSHPSFFRFVLHFQPPAYRRDSLARDSRRGRHVVPAFRNYGFDGHR